MRRSRPGSGAAKYCLALLVEPNNMFPSAVQVHRQKSFLKNITFYFVILFYCCIFEVSKTIKNKVMVYLLFKTDHHHSHASKDLIGVFTNKQKFRREVKKLIRDDIQTDSGRMDRQEETEYINWLFGFCLDRKQTQGLNNFELVWEEVELNKIF